MEVRAWGVTHELMLSVLQSTTMDRNGDLASGFMVQLRSDKITTRDDTQFLSVTLMRNGGAYLQISHVRNKNLRIFSRLFAIHKSANPVRRDSAKKELYRGVFVPSAEEFLADKVATKEVVTLYSVERLAIHAVIMAYATATNAGMQVISGELPLNARIADVKEICLVKW